MHEEPILSQDTKPEQGPVQVFRGRPLPEPGWPVGYAHLVERYDLSVPLPLQLTAVSTKYRGSTAEGWQLLPSRIEVPSDLGGHLILALKWEGVNLSVLDALFRVLDPAELTPFIISQPQSTYRRRVWFLYEWITNQLLPIPDIGKAKATPVLDPQKQFAVAKGQLSSRHKVVDNLPGTPRFCPLVARSEALAAYDIGELSAEVEKVLDGTHPDVIRRAGAFLLLKDSRASFRIEGEEPSANRLQRWGYAIGEAGRTRLSVDELVRLQQILLGIPRFGHLGLRNEGGFVGHHDRETRAPIPEHIDARPEDLHSLVQGVVDFIDRALQGGIDAVVVAAAAAFGLAYIHPFEDGNGRIHRWLIHHVLSVGGVTPAQVVFPVSRVILERIDSYKDVLSSYSRPLLRLIDWEETADHNVSVTNQTAHFYSYFDATRHAEFLYSCVEETIKHSIPSEVRYLEAFDEFSSELQNIVELPGNTVDLLVHFLEQNEGTLSQRARRREFAGLGDAEIAEIEALYAGLFGKASRQN